MLLPTCTFTTWLLFSVLALIGDVTALALPDNHNETELASLTQSLTGNLTGPDSLSKKGFSPYVTSRGEDSPGRPWLLSEFTYISLSFMSKNWKEKSVLVESGSYSHELYPQKAITWLTTVPSTLIGHDLFLKSNFVDITIQILSNVLSDLGKGQTSIKPMRWAVYFSNPFDKASWKSRGEFQYKNLSPQFSASTPVSAGQNLTDAQPGSTSTEKKRDVSNPQVNVSSSEDASLSTDTLSAQLILHTVSPLIAVPEVRIDQLVFIMILRQLLRYKPTDTLDSKFKSTVGGNAVIREWFDQYLIKIQIIKSPDSANAATMADLEYALRQIVIAPKLVKEPQVFSAEAYKVVRGGMGADPFAVISLETLKGGVQDPMMSNSIVSFNVFIT